MTLHLSGQARHWFEAHLQAGRPDVMEMQNPGPAVLNQTGKSQAGRKSALLWGMSLVTFMDVIERNEQKTRMILLQYNTGIKKCLLNHHKMDVHACVHEQRVDAPCPSFKLNFCSFPPALSQNVLYSMSGKLTEKNDMETL